MIRALMISLVLSVSAEGLAAGPIKFLCSWDGRAPLTITVDPEKGTASRDDGRPDYDLIRLNDFAVWLAVQDNSNSQGLGVQMIKRSKDTGGHWTKLIVTSTGAFSGDANGVCWEAGS